MSEREQAMMQNLSKLPPTLQDRFLDQVQGAAMALEEMEQDEPPTEDNEQ